MDKHHAYTPFCSGLADRLNLLNTQVADPKHTDAAVKELKLLNGLFSQFHKLNAFYTAPPKKREF